MYGQLLQNSTSQDLKQQFSQDKKRQRLKLLYWEDCQFMVKYMTTERHYHLMENNGKRQHYKQVLMELILMLLVEPPPPTIPNFQSMRTSYYSVDLIFNSTLPILTNSQVTPKNLSNSNKQA